MCTHNLCFRAKYENSQKLSNENCHFYSRIKSLYVAWACFRIEYKFHYFVIFVLFQDMTDWVG